MLFLIGVNKMNTFEKLLASAEAEDVDVIEYNFDSDKIKGLYCDGVVALSKSLRTNREKACILAEELGHYHTSVGDITDLKDVRSLKQERQARLWGYNNRIGLTGIIDSYKAGCRNLYEMAEYLEVTENFLQEALTYYKEKYGPCKQVGTYIIYFEPGIGVFERM